MIFIQPYMKLGNQTVWIFQRRHADAGRKKHEQFFCEITQLFNVDPMHKWALHVVIILICKLNPISLARKFRRTSSAQNVLETSRKIKKCTSGAQVCSPRWQTGLHCSNFLSWTLGIEHLVSQKSRRRELGIQPFETRKPYMNLKSMPEPYDAHPRNCAGCQWEHDMPFWNSSPRSAMCVYYCRTYDDDAF